MPAIQAYSLARKAETFTFFETPEPHKLRRKQLISSHPELRALGGPDRKTFIWIVSCAIFQLLTAFFLKGVTTAYIVLAAFTIGAVLNHGLFVLIHECTHNLVFKTTPRNRLAALVANLPITFPLAMGFRQYHLLHHAYKGDPCLDGDIPFESEARWVGRSPFRKIAWLMSLFLIEGVIRPTRFKKKISLHHSWVRINIVMQICVLFFFLAYSRAGALYLLLSSCFAFGLHPLGARFLQEHSTIVPNQETYSYYGICNRIVFNVGFHNEHHDLPFIPWRHLPKVRRIAPEYYEHLLYHTSHLRLLWAFFTKPHFNLYGRIVRQYTILASGYSSNQNPPEAALAGYLPERVPIPPPLNRKDLVDGVVFSRADSIDPISGIRQRFGRNWRI